MEIKQEYSYFDWLKLTFAVLIPLLHIPFEGEFVNACRLYLSHLGVPFFFAVSGFFLSKSIATNGRSKALLKILRRLTILLLFWTILDIPIICRSEEFLNDPIRVFCLKTPAYLWYVTGLIVAVIPFCLIRSRTILYSVAVALYAFGTMGGGSYSWLVADNVLFNWYNDVFLTTRNGVFFALPFLCVGELVERNQYENKKILAACLIMSYIMLALEMSFVNAFSDLNSDKSMFFLLPLFIYFLCMFAKRKVQLSSIDSSHIIRKTSGAIYFMQYLIINIGIYFLQNLKLCNLIVYIAVVVFPLLSVWIITRFTFGKKLATYIF